MLLTFSHLQRYSFNDTKADKKQFKSLLSLLKDKVDAGDLDDIHYFRACKTISYRIWGVEAPVWQGAEMQEYGLYFKFSQRGQAR